MEKSTIFLQTLVGEKLLESAGEKFLSGPEKALKIVGHVSDRFSDLFLRGFEPFSCQNQKFGGNFVLQACRPNMMQTAKRIYDFQFLSSEQPLCFFGT